MHKFIRIAIDASLGASKHLIDLFDNKNANLGITYKEGYDVVTVADKKSEYEIINMIQKYVPEHSIVSEECGYIEGTDRRYTWIIDPLDGTINYSRRNPHFCISIGLQFGSQICFGVIHDPLRHETYYAIRGDGAYMNNKRIRVSDTASIEGAVLSVDLSHREFAKIDKHLSVLSEIAPKLAGIRRLGSAALDLAYVACGRTDGYWVSGAKAWDLAAGSLIVQEAGGIVTDIHGSDKYVENGSIIACTPKIHRPIFDIISKHIN